MAVTAAKLAQTSLNVSGSVVTVVTGQTGGHTEIPSIYITNTNASTSRIVTILAHGSGASASNVLIQNLQIYPNSSQLVQLNGSPIILPAGDTLRAYQDIGTDVTITCYGVNEV